MTRRPHAMHTLNDYDERVIYAWCSCGGWNGHRAMYGRAHTLTRAHRAHQTDASIADIDAEIAEAEAWCRRTGHCRECGQPAAWCQCRSVCRCTAVHQTGAGIGRDPADLYADAAPIEQDGLFG